MWKFVSVAWIGIVLAAACQVTPPPPSQVQVQTIEREIQAAFDNLSDAVKTLDHDRYFSLFDAQTFSILNADGTSDMSLDAFRNAYMPQVEFIERYNRLEFSDVEINVIDANTAVLLNRYIAEVELKSGDVINATGAGAQVWSKRANGWKLVHVSNQAGS